MHPGLSLQLFLEATGDGMTETGKWALGKQEDDVAPPAGTGEKSQDPDV